MLIGFTAGKGAPGASLAVVNIGVALAQAKRSVVALDLDPCGGVLSAYLGGEPTTGLWPVIRSGQHTMPDKLAEQVQVLHGLPLIAGFPRNSDSVGINLVAVVQAAGRLAELVLVDAGRLPGAGGGVLEVCDRIILVVSLDPVGILAAEQALLSLSETAARRVSLLVTGTTYFGELRQVSELLSAPVLDGIPWAPDDVRRSREKQAPVDGRARKAFRKAADALAPVPQASEWARPGLNGLMADGT